MRSGSALQLVLLLASLQLSSSAPVGNPGDCCTKPVTIKIPLKMIVSYTETRSDCVLKAIVLHMKAGRKFCVDPDAEWVKSLVAVLKQRNKTTTALNYKFQHSPVGFCCTKLTTLRIPLKMIVSYTETRSDCVLKAIVLHMKSGRKICVDPDVELIKSQDADLKQRNNTTTAKP